MPRPLTLALAFGTILLPAQELTVYRFNAQVKGVDYCPSVEVHGESMVNRKVGILGKVSSELVGRQWDLGLVAPAERKLPGALKLTAEDGKDFDLLSLKGQVVVLGLFSVDCQASCVQLAELGDFQPKEPQFGMRLLPVSFQGWASLQNFRRRNRAFLPEGIRIYLPGTGEHGVNATGVELTGLPLVVMLDREGRIASAWTGFAKGRLLERLKALIPEKG